MKHPLEWDFPPMSPAPHVAFSATQAGKLFTIGIRPGKYLISVTNRFIRYSMHTVETIWGFYFDIVLTGNFL